MSFADASWIPAVGESLLHFIWQGALVALLLACALPLLRRRSANARYLAACGALLLMMALPGLTLWRLASQDAVVVPAEPARSAVVQLAASPLATVEQWAPPAVRQRVLPWLVLGWLAGVFALSVRFCGGWLLVRRLERIGTRAVASRWSAAAARIARATGIRRTVRVVESSLAQVPMVLGWFRPVILLPASALTGLTPQQLEAILAHELAHIRRNDYWMNLVQAAAEILLFYHPAVWWVSHRIRIEREHCCDDMGVAVCGDALTYARALVALEELRAVQQATPQPALALDGSPLLPRVRRLFEPEPPRHGGNAFWALGLLTAALLLALSVGTELSWAGSRVEAARPEESRTPADLALMVRYGVDDAFIESLQRLGYTRLSADELVLLRRYSVDAEYVQSLQDAGYRDLPAERLVFLRRYSVDAAYIREVGEAGYRGLSVDELVRLRRYGVDGELLRRLAPADGPRPTVDEAILAVRYGGGRS